MIKCLHASEACKFESKLRKNVDAVGNKSQHRAIRKDLRHQYKKQSWNGEYHDHAFGPVFLSA